jgi:hypothetical protein
MAGNSLRNTLSVIHDDYSHDPLNTFDWIMDVNELAGNKVSFYFIPEQKHPIYDSFYNLDEPVIRKLLKRIYSRGHEIGYHGSYTSYNDLKQTCREVDILRQVMEFEGIKRDIIGGRQHYLRWEALTTARNLDIAGMHYDSTLTYAERPGFRCGTSRKYPMYDYIEHKKLNLYQYPLIVMDASVIDNDYMNMGYTDVARDYMIKLKHASLRHGGVFTLLWHNARLQTDKSRSIYKELISVN